MRFRRFEKNCEAQCILRLACESFDRIPCTRNLSFYEQVCSLNDTPKPQTILDTSVATTNTASTSTAENLGNAPTPKGGG